MEITADGRAGQRVNPLEWRGYPLGLALSARGQSSVAQELKLTDFFVPEKTSAGDPDPGYGAFLTPGSGMGKKSRSGSGIQIRDVHPGSYFRERIHNFLG